MLLHRLPIRYSQNAVIRGGIVSTTYTCEPIHEKGEISEFLAARLREYNASKLPGYKASQPFGLVIREQGKIIGGMFGWSSFGWFYLDIAWIDEGFRKRGLGSLLLKNLESALIVEGIYRIRAETGSFQTLPFYLKHGFEVYAENDLFLANGEQHKEFLLRKIMKKP